MHKLENVRIAIQPDESGRNECIMLALVGIGKIWLTPEDAAELGSQLNTLVFPLLPSARKEN